MNVFDILKLLFTKIGDKDSIKSAIRSFTQIPNYLKAILGITVFIGIIYLGYTKLYNYELRELQDEVYALKSTLSNSVDSEEYSNDIHYLTEAIKICEQITKYEYEEKQFQLELIENYIKRNTPNDPVLHDIESIKKRSQFNYNHYMEEFNTTIKHCQNVYKPNKVNENKTEDK